MGKQKSFIKLLGSLGGLTFYENNGQALVRTTGGISDERIKKSPEFKRTRENMAEFGGSASIGKSLRMGHITAIKQMADNTIVGRIVGIMKRVNSLGSGARGKRSFEFVPNAELLAGFEFNDGLPLGSIFYAPNVSTTLNVNRDLVTLVVEDFDTDSYVNAPQGASHFQIVLSVGVLSDFVYVGNGYEAVNPGLNETSGITFSSETALGGMVGSDLVLTVDLGIGSAIPNTAAVVIAVGIVFSQEVNGSYYQLASDNAMRIELVG